MATDNLKVLLGAVLSAGELVSKLSDGLSFSDVAAVVDFAKKVVPAIHDAKAALAEYQAMSDAEAVDLEAYVVQNFSIPDVAVEQAIEGGLKLLIELHGLISLFPLKQPVPV